MNTQLQLEEAFSWLQERIRSAGLEQWLEDFPSEPTPEAVERLARFAYFTGIVNKAELGKVLGLDRKGLKETIARWYEHQRRTGCGAC